MEQSDLNTDRQMIDDPPKFVPRRSSGSYVSPPTSRHRRKSYITKRREKPGAIHDPVKSYGVIAVYVPEQYMTANPCSIDEFIDNVRILVCQRRDTIAYAVLVKGYYKPDTIRELVFGLTKEERHRLKNLDFDILWSDIWTNPNCRKYRDDYSRALCLFLRNRSDILSSISSTQCVIDTLPWGFTKGRKHPNESRVSCALREFEEETKIPRSTVKLINHLPPEKYKSTDYNRVFPRQDSNMRRSRTPYDTEPPRLVERIRGTDSLYYEYSYYIGYTKSMFVPPKKHVSHNKIVDRDYTISDEFDDIQWVSLQDAFGLLDSTRYDLAHQAIVALYQHFKGDKTNK